jgi:hypothetical protein
MYDDDSGCFVFDLGVSNEAIDLPIAVLDLNPFEMTSRFFQPRCSPFLGRRAKRHKTGGYCEQNYAFHVVLPSFVQLTGVSPQHLLQCGTKN